MKTKSRPFSYEASKCVLQYLPGDQRFNIRLRCPQLQTADSIVPLRIHIFEMSSYSIRIDETEYELSFKEIFCYGSLERQGCNRIKVIDHRWGDIYEADFETRRDLVSRLSFLLNKFLNDRRIPVVIGNFKLKINECWTIEKERQLLFPKDLKMKVKNLEVPELNKLILEQLSSHIIGSPLSSFGVLNVEQIRDPNFNCPLIRNAFKLDLPIPSVVNWSFDALTVFPQKEITLNNGHYGNAIFDTTCILNLILLRQRSHLGTARNISVNTDQETSDEVLQNLLRQPIARRAVLNDVESNQSDISCVYLPMGQMNELNVYGIPGTTTDTILKIVVMSKGSARLNE